MSYDERLRKEFSEEERRLIYGMRSDDVTFEMLSDGQKNAFIEIAKMIKFNKDEIDGGSANIPTRERHVSLNGFAGSGKSTLMKFVIDYMKFIGIPDQMVMACAPTHSAKKVLRGFIKREVETIHSLLKIIPIMGEKNLTFGRGKRKEDDEGDLSNVRYLICDESSFYDKYLFDTLLSSVSPYCLIIFVGDKEQLFGTSNKISPVFEDRRFKQLHLTEIKRTDSPIIVIGSAIRQRLITKIDSTWVDDNGNGVIRHFSRETFMGAYYDCINGNPENLLDNRVVSYYNANVNTHNFNIRQRIYGTKQQFVVGEYIVSQEPFMKLEGDEIEVLFENGTLLKILAVEVREDTITTPLIPDFFRTIYYRLKVMNMDSAFNEEYYIDVIVNSKEKEYDEFVKGAFDSRIGKTGGYRLNAEDSMSYVRIRDGRFLKVKHLPSCTIHKSQGSTVDNIFVDASYHSGRMFSGGGNRELLKQLDYVAITRAKKQVHIIY